MTDKLAEFTATQEYIDKLMDDSPAEVKPELENLMKEPSVFDKAATGYKEGDTVYFDSFEDVVAMKPNKIDIDAVLHRELVSQIRLFEEHKQPLTAKQIVTDVPTEKLINLAKFAVKYYEAALRNTQGVPSAVIEDIAARKDAATERLSLNNKYTLSAWEEGYEQGVEQTCRHHLALLNAQGV